MGTLEDPLYGRHIRIEELQYAASAVLTLSNDISKSRLPLFIRAPIGGIAASAETSHVDPLGVTIASVPGLDSYSISRTLLQSAQFCQYATRKGQEQEWKFPTDAM